MQNEPNLQCSTKTPGADCAKRTQFARQTCKTNPIPGGARWDGVWGTRIVEGNRAKRSQLPAGPGGTEPRGGGQGTNSCKTNPIPGRTRWPRSGGRGANMQNEANFARAPGNGRGRCRSGQNMRNKPNWPREGRHDRGPTQLYKQSQCLRPAGTWADGARSQSGGRKTQLCIVRQYPSVDNTRWYSGVHTRDPTPCDDRCCAQTGSLRQPGSLDRGRFWSDGNESENQ